MLLGSLRHDLQTRNQLIFVLLVRPSYDIFLIFFAVLLFMTLMVFLVLIFYSSGRLNGRHGLIIFALLSLKLQHPRHTRLLNQRLSIFSKLPHKFLLYPVLLRLLNLNAFGPLVPHDLDLLSSIIQDNFSRFFPVSFFLFSTSASARGRRFS